jgi:hypothetical protein
MAKCQSLVDSLEAPVGCTTWKKKKKKKKKSLTVFRADFDFYCTEVFEISLIPNSFTLIPGNNSEIH